MKDTQAQIAYKEFIGEHYFRMGFKVGWTEFLPGQFVMVDVPQVFLRRPFGIVKLENGILEVCVKVVGQGTEALSKIAPGQATWILGPLGQGFSYPMELKTALLVAGGYGIAPLLPLAKKLVSENRDVIFFYGAKNTADLLYIDELKNAGVDLHLATEDGSTGHKGLITERFQKEAGRFEGAITFVCGPQGLLKAVSELASQSKIPVQVSLERYMACGLGVCLGCVVRMKDGTHVRACREGPVFNAENVEWNAEKA
jgi:dihydroorotate dehydrogenase electron transfer subunit